MKAKYVGKETEERGMLKDGIHMMDKTLLVKGARISYSLWEVAGEFYFLFFPSFL